jgi:hypothetical protein
MSIKALSRLKQTAVSQDQAKKIADRILKGELSPLADFVEALVAYSKELAAQSKQTRSSATLYAEAINRGKKPKELHYNKDEIIKILKYLP